MNTLRTVWTGLKWVLIAVGAFTVAGAVLSHLLFVVGMAIGFTAVAGTSLVIANRRTAQIESRRR